MTSYTGTRVIDPLQQTRIETAASALGTRIAEPAKLTLLRSIVPFDQYAFSGVDYPGLGFGTGVMLSSDMPHQFLAEFLSRGLIRFDPLNALITLHNSWASWHDLTAEQLEQTELRKIKMLERHFGISTRSAIGFFRGEVRFGGAIFTRATPFTDAEKLILESVARAVHDDLSADHLARMSSHNGLTAGELACLRAVANGLSTEDASAATGYTAETIASYIKSVIKKLGVRNRTHAVADALRRRLID